MDEVGVGTAGGSIGVMGRWRRSPGALYRRRLPGKRRRHGRGPEEDTTELVMLLLLLLLLMLLENKERHGTGCALRAEPKRGGVSREAQ